MQRLLDGRNRREEPFRGLVGRREPFDRHVLDACRAAVFIERDRLDRRARVNAFFRKLERDPALRPHASEVRQQLLDQPPGARFPENRLERRVWTGHEVLSLSINVSARRVAFRTKK